ncbi:MAG: hypothetical protein KF868_15800 [Acidobacteria bacterium]|nr:hypothetical protein [Acidobacteriota bacterium]MCW5970345.1 hypothetical protein [Blastocatellales bacterium]
MIFLTAIAPVRAQYRFDAWTTDHGLPQNTVTRVIQTRDGYLWLATFDGLARFDGVRFTVFDKGNSKGIHSNRFTELYETADGALLVGTEDGGLTVRRNGIFTTYTTADGLPGDQVYLIFPDLDGEPVIATSGGPVYFRDGEFFPAPPQYQSETVKLYRTASGARVTVDAGGLRWVGEGREHHYRFKPVASSYLTSVWPYEDGRKNLWLGDESGLYLLRDGRLSHFPELSYFRPMCDDAEGGVWFGRFIDISDGARLARYIDGRFTVFHPTDGAPDTTIRLVTADREGSVWIAASNGLYRARKRLMTAWSTEQGLASNEVYPIMQSRSGDIWIGTTHGVTRVRFKDGKFNASAPIRLGRVVSALWEDGAGRIWIGIGGGLKRYENGKIRNLSALIDDTVVVDIKADRNGSVWVASNQGVFKLDGDKRLAHYTTRDGLPSDDVKVIHEDRSGALWFGTYGGLARFNGDGFVSYTVTEGLAGNRVRAIHEDADGVLWIGAYDDGLSRFADGKFFNYRIEHGLYNNGVFRILEDARGYFWISCNKGIYRVSRRELNDMAGGRISRINSVAFGKDDGMSNIECNGGRQPAGFIADDGRLWFPTMGGVVAIDPEAAQVNAQPPPVKIESVTLERIAVDFSRGVRIAPGLRDLEIDYAGLSFIKPEQVRFRYRLDGLDAGWIDAEMRRAAYFPYLSPGDYTFRVTAANSDGVWNEEGAALRVVVLAPFYRTWWFAALAIVGVTGVGMAGYRYRMARLRKEHAMKEEFSRRMLESQKNFSRQLLESQEVERKRIAAELHDSLGQRLLVIKNWAALSLMLTPEEAPVREQLNEISETAGLALEETRQIVYDLRPYQLDKIGLTSTLKFTIEQIASSSGIDISGEIDDLDGVFDPEDEIVFYRVVQECLNNIVKHSGAAEARVLVRRDRAVIRLEAADNGRGFALNLRDGRRQGFGLAGIEERVRMLGGECAIESAPGGGTTVCISINLSGTPDRQFPA